MIYTQVGIDLIPTHHENEIAQSKGACGKIPARYWLHGEYLLVDGGRMGKSLGNAYLLKDIINKGYNPLVYRLFSYSSHYRNKLNFTWEAIEATSKSYERLKNGYRLHVQGDQEVEDEIINKFEEQFHTAINDDLNMPVAMGVVWEVVRYDKKSPKFAKLLEKFDTVLGLKINEVTEKEEIPQEIMELVEKRKQARENKNWEESDKLRNIIQEKGYNIKDTNTGEVQLQRI